MKKTIILVGAGKGLGNAIGRKFGRNDFRVVLMARNENSLREYAAEFAAEGIEAHPQVADAADTASLTAAFDEVKACFGTPDVLVYNVGITEPDQPETIDSEQLLHHFQVDVASAYHCVQQVVSEEFGQKNGTILLTGGGLAFHPHPAYTPLSLDKAALRSMAFLLHDALSAKGIFVGTVTISGIIAPETPFAPDLIAETYWAMYQDRQEKEIVLQ